MKQSRSSKDGFVLLEVLPAIFLFSTCLLIGTRMYWAQLRMESLVHDQEEMEGAFLETWRVWEEGGGEAALAVKSHPNQWEIYNLPSDTWLPGDLGIGMPGTTERQIAFRKRLQSEFWGRSFWEVEVKPGQSANGPGWKWYRRVYRQAAASPIEEDRQ